MAASRARHASRSSLRPDAQRPLHGSLQRHAGGGATVTKSLLAIAVAGLVAVPAPTRAERGQGAHVEIEERTQHFEIRGATAEELVRQMRTLGPRKSATRRAWGLTTWELGMEYVLVPEREGCRVSDARVRLQIVTTLPKWRSVGRPSQQLRADWRDMLANLARHERTHRDHGVLAAKTAAAGLSALPLQQDCAAARREAGQVLRNAMFRSRQLSVQFDRDTHFGAIDGVTLRPGGAQGRRESPMVGRGQ
jgi:predicted secreted Zn-dependent protease